jgi:hypothetical protein
MKHAILSNLNDPSQLEKLYRQDRTGFKQAFTTLYPELKDNELASFWNARLNFAGEEISWGNNKDLLFVLIASFVAGMIARLPAFLHLEQDLFYQRNVGFIVFPALSAYFAWKNKLSPGKVAFVVGTMLVGVIFINFLPAAANSDTLRLSCVHLLFMLWSILGFVFVDGRRNDVEKRLGYLSYNGDLVVMTALIVISGAILSAITIGLFELIGIKIEKFYVDNIITMGLPAAPIIGTCLVRSNPQLVSKISPVIAKIFSPLVLVMLVAYLIAIVYTGKDPYNDREFLLMFNALLVGVMAIIFFSVAETSKSVKNKAEIGVLFMLSAVTIIVNGIALSAIVFRIAEWGITPNRTAVLGSNVLILVNLVLVTVQLSGCLQSKPPSPV